MKTVSFFGQCSARSELTLVCPKITHGYKVKKIRAKFASGCVNKMLLRFYIAEDDEAPSTGAPSGTSMLRDYGQVDYVTGENDAKDMQHEVEQSEGGSYLKVYANNTDYYAHDIDVQITIEPIKRGGD